jgi:hypothetical protein
LPGPLDDLARGLPQSQPGTIFGIPVARLGDVALQKQVLLIAGIALLVSIVLPFHLSPTVFAWSGGIPDAFKEIMGASFGQAIIWPVIAGSAYLLLTVAPPDIRSKIPPIVLHWLPFSVAFIGIFVSKMGLSPFGFGAAGGGMTVYVLGYAVLLFGLLSRISRPDDQIARIIIVVGAGMLLPQFFDMFDAFKFRGGFIMIITQLLWFFVTLIGVLCALFVVPPAKLPPALRAIDALAPMITAVLFVWPPLLIVLLGIMELLDRHGGISAILMIARGLLMYIAYLGVLMMTAPVAYQEALRMFKGGGSQPPQPPQGGGYPPQGGGYPPQGGGYPPQGGGGYPPQGGGGYPPQGGGGYPPQGGGYPPQGGGGWPQQ